MSLSSGYHPQSKGQLERTNLSLESAHRCVVARNPTSWSSFLPWVEYVHNSADTGLSPFMPSLGYQPPLFDFQEDEVVVPSVQVNLHHCRIVCRQICSAFLHSAQQTQRQANHHVPAPTFLLGQKVWLMTKDLPLKVDSQKLVPYFNLPFVIDHIFQHSAVHRKVPHLSSFIPLSISLV